MLLSILVQSSESNLGFRLLKVDAGFLPGKGIFRRQLPQVGHGIIDIQLVIDGHVLIRVLLMDQAPEIDELPEIEIRRVDDIALLWYVQGLEFRDPGIETCIVNELTAGRQDKLMAVYQELAAVGLDGLAGSGHASFDEVLLFGSRILEDDDIAGFGIGDAGKFGIGERQHRCAVNEFEPEQEIAHKKAVFHGTGGYLECLDNINDEYQRHDER